MISAVMSRLLWMSAVGGVVIAAVLLFRLLLCRAPKVFSYMLWSVVLFRLLCPFAWESKLSFIGLWQRAAQDSAVTEAADGVDRESTVKNNAFTAIGQFMSDGAADGFGEGQRFSAIPDRRADGRQDSRWVERADGISARAAWILFFVWIFGVFVLSGAALYRGQRLLRFLRGAEWEEKNIYVKSGLDTSFVAGCLRPKIYLPKGMAERERQYVLLHEQTHIRRGDALFRRLAFLALVLHWFNPLVWTAFFLSGRDMEMSCEEAVVRRLGDHIRRDYADSLLAAAVGNGFPMAFGAGDTKSRIRNVLRCKKVRPATAAVCILALAVLLAVFATNPGQGSEGNGEAGVSGTTGDGSDTQPDSGDGIVVEGDGPDFSAEDDGEDSVKSREQERFSAIVSVNSIAENTREIDSFMPPEEPEYAKLLAKGAVFAADCRFFLNYSAESFDPAEVSLAEFAEQVGEVPHISKPCQITFYGGQIHEITMIAVYAVYGRSYAPPDTDFGRGLAELAFYAGEGALEQYYTLFYAAELDVADSEGKETVEVYTGDSGQGEDGVVLVRDGAGDVLCSFYAYQDAAGQKSVYAGREAGGGPGFLLVLTLENRGDTGMYVYRKFRPSADGGSLIQIAGSSFTWGPGTEYDADEFAKWCHMLGHYLDDSELLLEVRDGEVRTGPVCDSDRYCYRTLVPQCYDDPYEGMDFR